jgi:hypothetical protein
MSKRLVFCALVLPMAATVGGCLFEAKLDATGGGTMTVTMLIDQTEFPRTQKKMESSAVKLTSSEHKTIAGQQTGIYKLAFTDVTKLPTTQFFRQVRVTRGPGSKAGTTTVSAKFTQPNALNMPESIAGRFGKEVKVVVTFPGSVVESNGKIAGETVTWSWPLTDFFNLTEVVMSATYGEGGTPAADAGTPTAGSTAQATAPATPKKK